MKISRLRLLGFKSFVEPAELVISPGLTGVVGPNGCGKSNLLEALRWVMGETSHKSMRAAAMDDVIFSGTTSRPARNAAEVTIFLDNAERRAPAEFNGEDVIEITRRIEREAGSAYRINGREVRARDVKILFEDAATGARSPALVRQGQIAEIVNAKPDQRRRILEDAAGIAGLHTRRHEAELRLRAAEANLTRLSDFLGQLNSQIESLKRQARAARRYKDISGEIRKLEALSAHLAWTEAQASVAAEEALLTSAMTRLGQSSDAEAKAIRSELEAVDALPPLRETEAAKGAIVARLTIERETFEKEAQRQAEREAELSERTSHLEADIAREAAFVAEARETVARLDAAIIELDTAGRGASDEKAAAQAGLAEALSALSAAERTQADLASRVSQRRIERSGLATAEAERRAALKRIEDQLTALEAQARQVAAGAPDATRLTAITEAGKRLSAEILTVETAALAAEETASGHAADLKARRDEAGKARLELNALTTERSTLEKLLLPAADADHPPIADALTVAPGYEAALGAALGDDLEAPASDDAPVGWRRLASDCAGDAGLPEDAAALSTFVEAPGELARRLAQTGVVERQEGRRLQALLKPGQRLVSREGDLWRWDGLAAAGGGLTPAAKRLAERNRLKSLLARETKARRKAEQAGEAEQIALASHAAAEAEERRLRQLWRETQVRLAEARDSLTVIERAARDTESRLASLRESASRAESERAAAATRLAETGKAMEHLDATPDLEPALRRAEAETAHCRNTAAETKARLAALEREHQTRLERHAGLTADYKRWSERGADAARQIETLQRRLTETSTELAAMAGLPEKIAARRQLLLSELSKADGQRRAAADRVAVADTALKSAREALRQAQGTVAEAREDKARTEARLEAARTRRQENARRIRDTFDVAPEACLAFAGFAASDELPDHAEAERQLQRLKTDRDRLGGVNLQADEELTVLQEQFAAMETEKNDVEQAIGKLRGAIGQLNREGKKRLDEAFQSVNTHFQKLFTTLFGGGEARLEMVDAEDPLEGGLEIIAKPPGKKPATLSLLSGGEQTLTALSLIFAVFLTNPSPICVLDEVDAPLDDANVDRFCTLMEHMAADTATRFLVITHHPMTMTRMNRLFGVTMAERGVSQLVSVDLETAQSFREAG